MPHSTRTLPALAGSVVFLLIALALFALERMNQEFAEQEARSQLENRAAAFRSRLESEMNRTIFVVSGFTHFVGANPGLGWDAYKPVAKRMVHASSHIINITLAPNNIIRWNYPREGNEDALGLRILEHPQQGDSLRRMIDSGRPVVTGPVDLVQGGNALIFRSPVYLDDGSYWGTASVPVDSNSVLAAAGLDAPQFNGLSIAIRGHDGLGADGDTFFGDASVFDADPILKNVRFEDQSWQLAVAPAAGWAAHAATPQSHRALGLALALTGGLVGGVLTAQSQRIRRVSRQLEAMVAAIPDSGFVIDDQGRYLESFGGQERRLYHDGAALKGRHLRDVMDDDTSRHALSGVRRAISEKRLVTLEYPLRTEDNALLNAIGGPSGTQWFQARIYPLPTNLERRPSALWLAYNITERRRVEEQARINEEQIRYLAMHDHLTGLANRAYLLEQMQKALNMAQRDNHQVGLLFLDLDHFKAINDAHGHDSGDLVLQEIAARLKTVVRDSDTVARHGGDEFVILLSKVDGIRGATAVAEKTLQALTLPIEANGRSFRLGVSIGISLYPDHGCTPDALQRAADDAMYAAKAEGRDQFSVSPDQAAGGSAGR
ncbi:diguanylate cyclase [Methylonatrum kenyense]|uniref:sensor domain-containing diguanylate cyclase n=1 Tax=Methylonatrum kenyense TaxID=455253 RepID=UPI0020BD9B8F|nr:diguanylate cyclase [Methylonatrum kenyense]MCK8515609.1 diguanylate cyclase [Methylonatrum kenyense]